tara:strand:- start:9573 stop:10358 length:786 start_codon:yes stop_codon:yes gene_type:complete
MGKKRRFIHRARKFAKKYFKILDGFDGNDDAQVESYGAFIDTITATDNNNQTVTFTGRVLGKVSVVTNLGIETNIDDAGFVVSPNDAITDNGSGDIDEYTYTSNPTGVANALGIGAPLSVGTHTVVIRPKGSTDPQLDKKVSFTIRENKIAIVKSAFADDTAGNIAVTAANVIGAGKKVAGSDANAEFAQNGYKVTAKDAAGNTLAVTARADVNKNAGTDGDILTSDVANGTVVTLTITPKDNTNALLNDSAIEHTITVTA